jgi:uncharacterized membrane protein YkoI
MKISGLIIGLIFCFMPYSANVQAANVQKKQALVVKSPQQAARIVKSRVQGKVLKVSKRKSNNRIGYKVKMIKKDGHIVSVLVDAHTGRVKK